MKLSSDAMMILVGMLNDLHLMQRKVDAGQGATCEVHVFEGEGAIGVTFEASIDTEVVVGGSVPSQEA